MAMTDTAEEEKREEVEQKERDHEAAKREFLELREDPRFTQRIMEMADSPVYHREMCHMVTSSAGSCKQLTRAIREDRTKAMLLASIIDRKRRAAGKQSGTDMAALQERIDQRLLVSKKVAGGSVTV
tara:strand:- start:5058 stop:5438 length:381 start_codon:yes stop_codon:yes gene_type:complete